MKQTNYDTPGFEMISSQPKKRAQVAKSQAKTGRHAGGRGVMAPIATSAPLFVQERLFAQSETPQELEERLQEQPPETAAGVERQPVETVRVQLKRGRRSNAARVPVARALGGNVSVAPVFIPAAQIRQERSQRDAEKGAKAEVSGASLAVPLTAEMLSPTMGSRAEFLGGWNRDRGGWGRLRSDRCGRLAPQMPGR